MMGAIGHAHVARFFKGAACIAATLALLACRALRGPAPAVVVSSKLSSESAMIGEMIRLVLSAAGIPTVDRIKLGATPVVRRAPSRRGIDLYVEYTGNGGLLLQYARRSSLEGLQAGVRARRTARLRSEPHRLADTRPGEQRLGARRAPGRRRRQSSAHHERLRDAGYPGAARWCSPARPSSPMPARCARSRRRTGSSCALTSSSCSQEGRPPP